LFIGKKGDETMKKLIATITAFVLVFSGLVYVQPVKTVEAAGNVWDGTTADTSWYDAKMSKTSIQLQQRHSWQDLQNLQTVK